MVGTAHYLYLDPYIRVNNMNIAAILVAGRATGRQAKAWLFKDVVLYPAMGFIGLITLSTISHNSFSLKGLLK